MGLEYTLGDGVSVFRVHSWWCISVQGSLLAVNQFLEYTSGGI